MYKPEIAIILPTFKRDDILMKCINSILDVWQDNWQLIIIDQNEMEDYSLEKQIFYQTAASPHHSLDDKKIIVIPAPNNYDIMECYNSGIEEALNQHIPYCLITNDNILFTESMKRMKDLFFLMGDFDVLDFPSLENPYKNEEPDHVILEESTDPINPLFTEILSTIKIWIREEFTDYFFIAKTNSISTRTNNTISKIGFTDYCEGKYETRI